MRTALQWGRGLSTPEMRRPAGDASSPQARFNGAGVFRPRKSNASSTSLVMVIVLQWGRGLSTPEILQAARMLRIMRLLQWGRGLSTPEIAVRYLARAARAVLQWGRGLSTPEIFVSACELNRALRASMGPGSFDPGNSLPEGEVDTKTVQLQWGRGLSTPEIGFTDTFSRQSPCASMGPGSFDPGNLKMLNGTAASPPASMGPGSFDPGNALAAYLQAHGLEVLQWGRGLSTPEMRRGAARER